MLRLPYILSFATLLIIIGCGGGGGGGETSDEILTGLDARPSDSACNAFEPEGGISIDLAPEFSALTFIQPVALLQNPVDSLRWYVIEQSGKIHTFQEGDSASTLLLDISSQIVSGGEAGLLGMAFHPEFSTNGEIYLSYTSTGTPLISNISRITSSDSGLTADLNTETVLLSVDQPYMNHNGGWISFGPDGYLYIGFGDGGSGGDPDGNGQDTKTLLGSILRIDVNNADAIRNIPYAIPAGNPFETSLDCSTGCPEIFSWGFRNPWRWSFDILNGNMWAGDVGQTSKEEINLVTLGGNYGWNTLEGNDCYPPGSSCNTTGLAHAGN
jgi:glucose/arabinose dehydrogenase